MDTVVVIPAYKPDMRLCDIARSLCAKYGVLIVDDGSGSEYDRVFETASQFAYVLRYEKNRGKGGALKYAFSKLASLFPDAEYVVTADADGQHTPSDIDKVALELHKYGGLVLGGRAFKGRVPFRSRFGNTVTRFVFAIASETKIRDTQTGLRGFDIDYLDTFAQLQGDRYEYEMTMLMIAAGNKIPIHEVEIETIYENNNESSHFNAVKDSLKIYLIIYKYSAILKYLTSSLLAFVVNYVLALLFRSFVFKGFSADMELSATLAWVFSSFLNFNFNRSIVFHMRTGYLKSMAEYYGLAVITMILKNYVFQVFLTRVCHIPFAIAIPVAEIFMYAGNYIVQKKFIFKK